jgi:hypothetical protein
MPVASMAEHVADEPGAPIAKDAIDPDLVKLGRARPKIGVITAAGLVFLGVYFIVRLNPDRKFAGGPDVPDRVAVGDVVAGRIATERFIRVDGADLLVSHAVRTTTAKGSLGLRVVPLRGTGEKLWIAMSGDSWEQPTLGSYGGRLRKLSDLPFAAALADYANEHPRPVFAAASAVRGAFATGKLQSVSGDAIAMTDGDRVAFDVLDPNAAVIVASITEHMPNVNAWTTALAAAGITIKGEPHQTDAESVRFDITDAAVNTLTTRLEAANLWAARVEPVTHHFDTTWGELKSSPPAGFVVTKTTIPDAQLDLVGLYVERAIPSDAYVVLTGEHPDDYWYVLPITIALGVIVLVFGWALIRAVKRDLLPTRA